MKELFTLFWAFFRIGSLMFGGGYSMLPLLHRTLVDKYAWTTDAELLDYFAVGQCAPGIIAVNTAIFVGHSRRRVAGALCAAAGVIMPSFLIITLIAVFFHEVVDLPHVRHALAGVRVGAGALIVSAVVRLVRENVRRWFQILLCVASFALVAVFGQSPVWAVFGAGLFGFAHGKWGKAK